MLLPTNQNHQGAAVTAFYMLDTLAVMIFIDCQNFQRDFEGNMRQIRLKQEQIIDERKLRGENSDLYWCVCLY